MKLGFEESQMSYSSGTQKARMDRSLGQCMCDDECPHCGARDMTPYSSEDLTELIEQDGNEFVALRSPASAEHDPDYRELGRFPSRAKAEECLGSTDPT